MTDTILCVDIGTSSLKAALLSDKCTVEAFSREPLAPRSSRTAEEWMDALGRAVSKMHEENSGAAIEAICVSGNGPTLVAESGGESVALLWNDGAAENPPETKSLYIPRLSLFKERLSAAWNAADTIFSGPEYLLYRLTGEKISILPEARFRPAYWSDDELLRTGFSRAEIEKIPPFAAMGSFVGKVCEKAALSTGLLEGTLVFAGAPDFVVALLGTGTIFPGTAADRAGSSEGLNLCTSRPVSDPSLRTLPSAIDGLWNVSALIERSGKTDETLSAFKSSLDALRDAAKAAGERFPSKIAMTGGQARDRAWVQKKADAAQIQIDVPWCPDAELIGDLILARVGLGDYDDVFEAAMCLCASNTSFFPGTAA